MKKKAAPKRIKHQIHTQYLGSLFDKSFLKMVPDAVKRVKSIKKKHYFDAIAFTGTSGAGLAFLLSYFIKVPLIHIRKSGTSTHYHDTIEGTISSQKYLIVDDFISTGSTIKNITSAIKKDRNLKKAKPVGIFLYDSCRTKSFGKIPVFTLE